MKNILLISSIPRGDAALSRRVARLLRDLSNVDVAGVEITVRDLVADPLPYLDEDGIAGWTLKPHQRTVAQQAAINLSNTLATELFAADVIVIASGMTSLAPTSALNAWFDYVFRCGVSVGHSEKEQHGRLGGKEVYLVQERHGTHSQGPMQPGGFQKPYTKGLLAGIGFTDVHTIEVDGA